MGVQDEQRVKEDFKRLQHENRTCPHCDGNGLVIVFHPAWDGDRVGVTSAGRPFPAEVAAHCLCPVGRWIRERVEFEEQRRIPRVEDIVAGRSKWLMKPPSRRDAADGPPAPTRRDINAMFQSKSVTGGAA